MSNGWTEERRKRQAELIRGWRPWAATDWSSKKRDQQLEIISKRKPWLSSTGPVTATGKQKVSLNAYKHGFYTKEALLQRREANKIIKRSKDFVKFLR